MSWAAATAVEWPILQPLSLLQLHRSFSSFSPFHRGYCFRVCLPWLACLKKRVKSGFPDISGNCGAILLRFHPRMLRSTSLFQLTGFLYYPRRQCALKDWLFLAFSFWILHWIPHSQLFFSSVYSWNSRSPQNLLPHHTHTHTGFPELNWTLNHEEKDQIDYFWLGVAALAGLPWSVWHLVFQHWDRFWTKWCLFPCYQDIFCNGKKTSGTFVGISFSVLLFLLALMSSLSVRARSITIFHGEFFIPCAIKNSSCFTSVICLQLPAVHPLGLQYFLYPYWNWKL